MDHYFSWSFLLGPWFLYYVQNPFWQLQSHLVEVEEETEAFQLLLVVAQEACLSLVLQWLLQINQQMKACHFQLMACFLQLS